MNKAKLKTFAPQARKDFIAAVMARANLLGISEKNGKLEIAPSEKKGDVTLIAGQAWPAKVHDQRERLIKRMQKVGAGETAEAIAYTWFNRFAALRFMEVHDYLGHGHRVLSSREGGLPEILTHATELAGVLPGLNVQQIADMKLAGNKDGELYRLLLVAQCNALSNAMPFLFERIDDESELLLPGNLERTDSVVAKLVEAIPEEDWNEVEVIGWLYQFYISEKKDEVIGKVVKSEDIPAATQLFTPNWIVQYLVQNSVGRLWLMANPSSSLKSQWPYYIEPAEQTPEVQAQLDALIKTRMDEDGGSLNPETITVLDPACGSGHILVEAYEVLKGIYLERGYQARSIPRLILEKNLYGLDIDDRAAQLAGFALLMKARADDRRLLETPVKLNVLSLQESAGMDLDEFAGHLKPHGINRTVLGSLLDTFTHAKTFGSLIQIPKTLEDGLADLEDGMAKAIEYGDVFAKSAAQDLVPLVQQATILAMKFDAVVANPPYMGNKGMNAMLRDFALKNSPGNKNDLFAIFAERILNMSRNGGISGLMTPFVWMFLKSYEELRKQVLVHSTMLSLVQPEYHSFFESAYVPVCAFLVQNFRSNFNGTYFDLSDFYGADKQPIKLMEAIQNSECPWRYTSKVEEFTKIPGNPIAYTASEKIRSLFANNRTLGDVIALREGIHTANNELYLRYWFEIDFNKVIFDADSTDTVDSRGKKWVPYNKGGAYRKWYGNNELVIAFDSSSRASMAELKGHVRPSQSLYFLPGGTWSALTSGNFGLRYYPAGFLFDSKGQVAVGNNYKYVVSLMNTKVITRLAKLIMPTLDYKCGDVRKLPYLEVSVATVEKNGDLLREISKCDWDSFELSWDFLSSPLIYVIRDETQLSINWEQWRNICNNRLKEMQSIEARNNALFIDAFNLADEMSSDVSEDEITLARANREKDSQRLISYAIGCVMGRYSLDELGLIYAHAGNVGFDATRYKTFPADADGIIPITDELWFEDDATNRIREFILAVWPAPAFEENLAWLAESLGTKGNETPAETIRRYLASSFFKDHLQTYKKRPIYWLFSSGKQGAFQALVYLHRYHEGTLARMRAEYVVPLTGKMQSRIEMLEKDMDAASSTAARNKIAKQIESLKKRHVELLAYDEKLRHYADMRISLDLDDGVKANYGKFGDLLAEVKAVTGGASDE
jgi:type II restriction/modification system DNA methylase subunit YeeA